MSTPQSPTQQEQDNQTANAKHYGQTGLPNRSIYLTNTLTKKKEKFNAIQPATVKIYACGVTTYDFIHLGHARGALVQDVLRRFLQAMGWRVVFVKNFTDIDDKIITRANQEKIEWYDLSSKMIKAHDQDMEQFGILPPDSAPKASEYIAEMIETIEALLKKDFAYVESGDVFFRTQKFAEYGALSGKKTADLILGFRVDIQQSKANPLDFVLWKAAKEGEPSFLSPWGPGRPGWHIECSAMSEKILQTPFDIHMGGSDLIFPHHENEIAQSQCASGTKLANYWLHNEMVKIEGRKMSKSLGNFFFLRDLMHHHPVEAIRLYLLQTHYRQIIDFQPERLTTAAAAVDKLYQALLKPSSASHFDPQEQQKIAQPFFEALADDLNTAKALSICFDWAKQIQKSSQNTSVFLLQQTLKSCAATMGILQQPPEQWFHREQAPSNNSLTKEQIEQMVQLREQARQEKNWQKADQIRNTLLQHNIQLADENNKTRWWHSQPNNQ